MGLEIPFRCTGDFSPNFQFPAVGNRAADFSSSVDVPRLVMPVYIKVDLHVGVHFGIWKASLYANNVGNERGIVYATATPGSATIYGPATASYMHPKTIGLSLSDQF